MNPIDTPVTLPSPAQAAASGFAPATTNTLAIVSLVLGIAAFLVGIFLPFLMQIGAVVCGHLARRQIAASRGAQRGEGMALAGLILGYIGLVLWAVVGLFIGGSVMALAGLAR